MSDRSSTYSFFKKVLIFVAIVLSTVLLVMFVGQALNTLLLIFGGVLLGVIFRVARDFINQKTNLGRAFSLGIVLILFLSITVGGTYLLAPRIANQASTFTKQVPKMWEMTKQEISQWGWGRELANENPRVQDFFEDETGGTGEDYDMTKTILSYLSFSLTVAAGLILIFVIAIYIAAEPKLYSKGFVKLFPEKRRERVIQIMDEISMMIQWWMVGQVCSMLIVGTVTTLGLWLLGVPYYFILGIFAALMNFIPNLGPIIAAIPAIGVALTVGIDTAIYVAIFYTALQSFEGYVIVPMVHRRAINVPPVLIITVQFLLFYMIGFLGVLLAMPLIGCGMILVKRLYMEDILEDSGQETASMNMDGKNIFDEETGKDEDKGKHS